MAPRRQAAKSKTIRTPISRSQVPTIACINEATVDLEVDFDDLIAALQKFVDRDFAPIWGTPAKLVKAKKEIAGAWTMIFLDNADKARSLGHHKLTKDNLPSAKIFVKPSLAVPEQISVVASHELAEMLVDPSANMWCAGPDGVLYAYEICDAVEEQNYDIDRIAVSNFCYPAYFEAFRKPGSARFDHLGNIKRPFQILHGGYLQACKGDKVNKEFGSAQKEMRFRKEDRRMHRSEYREAQLRNTSSRR